MELDKQANDMGVVLFPEAVKAVDYMDSKCDFLLRMRGNSMAPKYPGGDILACKVMDNPPFIQWGRVFAFSTKPFGVIVARIYPSEKEGWFRCVSDNPDYAPFEIPKSEIPAFAMVIGSISMEG